MGDFIELAEDGESASQRIAEALRDARAGETFDAKIKSLACAMHILVDPSRPNHLIDNFIDEMLEFAELGEARIICLIIDFLQKACAKDPTISSRVLDKYNTFLTPNPEIPRYFRVIKRVIVACTNLYPVFLHYGITHPTEKNSEACWESLTILKTRILTLVDCDNDGIRTVAIKFIEAMVICQSPKPKDLLPAGKLQPNEQQAMNDQLTRFNKVSLNDITRNHRFISYRKTQLEAEQNFTALIKMTTVAHITAQNLLTVIDALCLISRCRPHWENALIRVFDAMKALHSNVPPTLSAGQVKALRKELKRNFLRFLRLPAAQPLQAKIKSQLTDYLGANLREVMQAIPAHLVMKPVPKPDAQRAQFAEPAAKKPKTEGSSLFQDDDDEEEEPSAITGIPAPSEAARTKDAITTAIDVTEQYVFERLNPPVVTNLVIIALLTLPDEMPPSFASSYTPIETAGTEEQIREVSRMIATQATQKEIGPGFEEMKKIKEKQFRERQDARREGIAIAATPLHLPSSSNSKPVLTQKKMVPPVAPVLKSKKAFNLIEDTKQLSLEDMDELFEIAFESVLMAERRVVQGGATNKYQQLVVRLASRYKEDCTYFEDKLVKFICDDHKKRTDLALLWICELYAQYQGFSYCSLWLKEYISGEDGTTKEARYDRYDRVCCKILNELMVRQYHRETLFFKILLESPLVTPNAFEFLKKVCMNSETNADGMAVLRELILTRNRQRPEFLQFFFSLCFMDRVELRNSCIETAKELCNLPHIRTALSERAVHQINDCLERIPPDYIQIPGKMTDIWTEDMFKSALVIYTTIMPFDSSLLLPLGSVYASGTTIFKKVVLRSIEPVMRSIGMRDQQVLRLIEECPPGAETLVARIVHLLTERNPATPELVARAKKLHDERHMDIRALIPIVGGLTRDEVVRLIPQFVLRAEYQKSVQLVFRRLYNAKDSHTGDSSFDPIDLIKQYHLVDPKDDVEMEYHINNLHDLFDTKLVKREVVSQAIEAVFEVSPLPYLFLHSLYVLVDKFTALESFVSTLLQKVAERKLWQESSRTKSAFFIAVRKLKTTAYGAVLTCFTFEEYCELKSTLGTNFVEELKEFFPTLSTSQQKSVDEKIKEEVYDKERENRDRRIRKEERREKEREKDRHRDSDRNSRTSSRRTRATNN